MEKSIGLMVTVEFDCPNMLSEQDFHDQFGSDPMAAYRVISDNLSDNPWNFSSDERVISVKVSGDSTPEYVCSCNSKNYGYGAAKCFDCGKLKEFIYSGHKKQK